MAKVSKNEYYKGREKSKEFKPEYDANATELLRKINIFIKDYPRPVSVSSGYRPASYNANVPGAANKSNHTTCRAIDILDMDLTVWKYCMEQLDLAKELGLYFEDKRWTSSWVHIQDVPPKSGKRMYVPNSNPADRPDLWDGRYSKEYDNA